MARRLDPEERRRELIEFGREHFATHAFDALAIDDIAAQAGVSKGTIYKYFGGRRGFYLASIEAVIDEVIEAITPPVDAAPDEALRDMTTSFVDYAEANSAIYLALVRGGLGADEETNTLLDRVRLAAIESVNNVMGLNEMPPATHLAVSGWVSFVEAVTAQWLTEKSVAKDEVLSLVQETLIQLLGRFR